MTVTLKPTRSEIFECFTGGYTRYTCPWARAIMRLTGRKACVERDGFKLLDCQGVQRMVSWPGLIRHWIDRYDSMKDCAGAFTSHEQHDYLDQLSNSVPSLVVAEEVFHA